MSKPFELNIERKKGDPNKLKGKLIAYATVDPDISSDSKSLGSMIRNGILAVQANYVDQRNIRDFFQTEFGVSLEKGIEEIIEQAKESGGLEGALDPEVVRDKLESMRNMEFIPIPAKIAFFESEEEIMQRDEDIYYLGHFKVISHSHLCVNSFPILYQAKFREQEHSTVTKEIEDMLSELENPKTTENDSIINFKGDMKEYLLKKMIPKMLYNLENEAEYGAAENQLKSFMADYAYPEDTEAIIKLVKSGLKDDNKLMKLELMVEKIQALQNENYEQLEIIRKKMKKLK